MGCAAISASLPASPSMSAASKTGASSPESSAPPPFKSPNLRGGRERGAGVVALLDARLPACPPACLRGLRSAPVRRQQPLAQHPAPAPAPAGLAEHQRQGGAPAQVVVLVAALLARRPCAGSAARPQQVLLGLLLLLLLRGGVRPVEHAEHVAAAGAQARALLLPPRLLLQRALRDYQELERVLKLPAGGQPGGWAGAQGAVRRRPLSRAPPLQRTVQAAPGQQLQRSQRRGAPASRRRRTCC